jgi:DNA-directed RNA polymerase specialized sigma24 family protein
MPGRRGAQRVCDGGRRSNYDRTRAKKVGHTKDAPRDVQSMSEAMPTETQTPANDPLGDPALRRSLADFVRRRVPSSDVDDVVQTVLVEALASPNRPKDPAELRRWVLGIARHKVVDLHRRVTREPPSELPDIEAGPPPLEARALARWAEEQAGSAKDAQKTLDWMAREGEGEKLEAIAAEEKVPAARVRQRVSRMRRWMKERWTAELAAVAMLAVLALAAWWILRKREPEAKPVPELPPTITPEPPSPLERARVLRADAFAECERGAWQPCLDGLDRARALDPVGDTAPAVGAARAKAQDGLRAAPSALPLENTAVPPAPDGDVVPPAPSEEMQKKAPTTVPTGKPMPKPTAPKAPTKSGYDKKGELGTPGGTGFGSGKKRARASKQVLDQERY